MLVLISVSNSARNCHQFCKMLGIKQIMQSPTCIRCRSTPLIDHILARNPSQISQQGVFTIKAGDVHKHISFHLFKKYTVDAYKNDLKNVNFPNYKLFKM